LGSEINIDINNPPLDKNRPPNYFCIMSILSHAYFVLFVIISIYVLINILVAVLLKHLEVLKNYFINAVLKILGSKSFLYFKQS